MPHVHQQIRAAVTSALTGLPTTGARVFANRVYPLGEADLPGIRLYALSESAETDLGGDIASRDLTLSVEACAKAKTGLDDVLDQIGLEIESALFAPLDVNGNPLHVEYVGMKTELDDLEVPVGIKRHIFRVRFSTTDPETFI